MTLIPVIISGGAGARLWPLSRDAFPKPFIPLPDGTSLVSRTYLRAARLDGVKEIITVTNRNLLFLTADAYAETDIQAPANTFLLEPTGRDTAAAVAVATLHAAATQGTEALLLILPADHLISNEKAFAQAINQAIPIAQSGRIVTFGIVPDRLETGFGYLETTGETVQRFVEKPDAETAAAYISNSRYFWNSGMFCFTVGTMLAAMEKHCPDILTGARSAYEEANHFETDGNAVHELPKPQFCAIPSISIDYAVMEKAEQISCVPLDCGWSDIGSWTTFAELSDIDEQGNRSNGEAILEDVRNCFVHSEDRLVGLVGVENLLVVDTPDALLVASKDKAQEVKTLFNRLKSLDHEAAKLHRTAHRPWGTYTVLEEGERFKIKRIVVKPGGRLSLQSHYHRSEHWVVVSGTAKIMNGDREILLTTNQSTYIPSGHRHRLENPGMLPLVLIEVQSGDYVGEDDIVRYDDIYGRS